MTNAYLVNNEEEVRENYYYKNSKPPTPDRFPCIMIEEDNVGGIGGSYYSYSFAYPPAGAVGPFLDMWVLGFLDGANRA